MRQIALIALFIAGFVQSSAVAEGTAPRVLAERLFSRLASGAPYNSAVIEQMTSLIAAGDHEGAARVAVARPEFVYTLIEAVETACDRNYLRAQPWNECTITFAGNFLKSDDYRQAFLGSTRFRFNLTGLTAHSLQNNDHYSGAWQRRFSFALDSSVLVEEAQQYMNGTTPTVLPPEATAGIITTSHELRNSVDAGTNRRAIERLMNNYAVYPELMDTLRFAVPHNNAAPVVRTDVEQCSVTPGLNGARPTASANCGTDPNDSVTRDFQTKCVGCHAYFLERTASAFNGFDINGNRAPTFTTQITNKVVTTSRRGPANIGVEYTATSPTGHTFSVDFSYGTGQWMQWETTQGSGVHALVESLVGSFAFKRAAVMRAFAKVCGRLPEASEKSDLESFARFWGSTLQHSTKELYARVAARPECLGR